MKQETFNKIYSYIIKFICLELWIFVAKVGIVVVGLIFNASFVEEGHFIGEILMRHPYRWDFETMIASIYVVWGFFLWKASINPEKHRYLIQFTIYANLLHGSLMFVQALIRTHETMRLLGDTTHLFLPVAILLGMDVYMKKRRKQ